MHDYAYTLFEEKLREDGKLLELTDPLSETFKQDMEKTSFVKVTGRSLFTDVPLLTKLLSEFNSMGEALTYLTASAELSVAEAATEDKLKDVPDRNEKAGLREQIKNATHIKRLATEKGLHQDPTLLKHLTYLMTYMMKDDFEVQLSLASADDKQVFFKSPLTRDSLREPCDAIVRKYSRQCEEPLTLFGIITQGRKDRAAAQAATPETQQENFRIALLRMVNATAAIEESFFGRLENEYVIDPIALFRQL